MASLAEQIAQISNPIPKFDDPEDAFDQGAKLVEKFEGETTDLSIDLAPSKLRRHTSQLLSDFDRRYAGKKTSREKLIEPSLLEVDDDDDDDDDDEEESDDDNDDDVLEESEDVESDDVDSDQQLNLRPTQGDDDDDDDDDDEGSGASDTDHEEEIDLDAFRKQLKLKEKKEFSMTDDGDYSKYADDYEEGSDSEDGSDSEEVESRGSEEEAMEEDGVQPFSKAKVDEEIAKGQAARAQLGLWDNFLESRIKLQKALVQVNKLPHHSSWKIFSQSGGDDFKTSANQSQAALKTLLDQLVNLQTALLLQNPETRHIVDGQKKPVSSDPGNEEIPSDSDIDSDAEEEKELQKLAEIRKELKRKITIDAYPDVLAKRHKAFQNYRNQTIQKWNDKTQLSSGKMTSKFSAFDQSALKQIQQILSDQNRLINRTRVRRSTYRILGKTEEEEKPILDESSTEALPRRQHLQKEDCEIFDDDDFYHQLLRELIERKASDTDDPAAISRQWLEVQKLRGKVKKVVDRKASKGRKLRYDVHPKLVNFMAANDTSTWVEESRDELFNSLFGSKSKPTESR